MGASSSSSATALRSNANTKPHQLSETDAWAFALAWRDQLRGYVRLETETEAIASSIVPTFDWVTFVLNGRYRDGFPVIDDPQKLVADARAATIVWFALSCCEGYSGTENPAFWRRVFHELLYPKKLPPVSMRHDEPRRPQMPMTEAVRFFDQPGKQFPRIKLVVGEMEDRTTCPLVYNGRLSAADPERDRKLGRILTQIKPFIRATHWARRVELAIDELPVEKVVEVLRESSLSATIVDFKTDQDVLLNTPRFQLVSVAAPSSSDAFAIADKFDESRDVELRLSSELSHIVSSDGLCRGLLPEHHTRSIQGPRLTTHIPSLSIQWPLDVDSSPSLGMLCSALPHIQSIKSLSLLSRSFVQATPSSRASDWEWLAYAIFHPDSASQSGFTSLEVQLSGISAVDIASLKRAATGFAMQGDEGVSRECPTYIEGRVASSVPVWAKPHDGATPMHTLVSDTWLTVGVASLQGIGSREWVRAVLPGHGFSWIRSLDVTETRSRQPGRSCIRNLRVHVTRPSLDEDKLTDLLAILGQDLTTLRIGNYEHASATTIRRVMQLCPRLKSLLVYHDGSAWADELLAMDLPVLEELELQLGGWREHMPLPLKPIKAVCLPRLKAFCVNTTKPDECARHEGTMLSFLRENQDLQYLHWSRRLHVHEPWITESYDNQHNRTRTFQKKLNRMDLDTTQGPFQYECRVAFLSVVRHLSNRLDLGEMEEDIISLIFAYATSTIKRVIFIE